ncbi:transcription antitermination factor NusB [Myxacorys almedinensis]|uniref:Transcription antitermination protein NusB n=1 Tax=Myxacorys almedinensis A TaxID=2690445 RepID=A0A8J7Z3M4_9CYAN|nr:transcription antitermination factor NusB [Myxacorys almedinensis]NDJ19372.1 transcription antitermination protein NusB [Myxacorys almedinensis A]
MQARRISRELALLSISQLPSAPERLGTQKLQDLVVAAVRTLATEARDTLEAAAAELQRGNSYLLTSETRASTTDTARRMVADAIALTETAINRLGGAIEIPEFIQLANQTDVRAYALEIITRLQEERPQVDAVLNKALIDWQLDRLAAIDQDILRIAVTEMMFLGIPDKVAINEAIEMAKRYSGDDGHRFINGVLRKVTEHLKAGVRE